MYSSVYFGGSGSGGRVSIRCRDEKRLPQFTFQGRVSAYGGQQAVTGSEVRGQSPIWVSNGATLQQWLDKQSPTRAAPGTIVWETSSAVHSLGRRLMLVVSNDRTSIPSNTSSDSSGTSPSEEPTASPTALPLSGPIVIPSYTPSDSPSASPSLEPTAPPTTIPSLWPSVISSSSPSDSPSASPSVEPTAPPTTFPSSGPTVIQSYTPSDTASPTALPLSGPTVIPSNIATFRPSATPSSLSPSHVPTYDPTAEPLSEPTREPTSLPSVTSQPTPLSANSFFALAVASTEYDFSNYSFDVVVVRRDSRLVIGSQAILYASALSMDSDSTITVGEGGRLVLPPSLSLYSGHINVMGTIDGAGNITMHGDAMISLHPGAAWNILSPSRSEPYIADIYNSSSLTVSVFNLSYVELHSHAGINLMGGNTHFHRRVIILCARLKLLDQSYISASGFGFLSTSQNLSSEASTEEPPFRAAGSISFGNGGWHAGVGGGTNADYNVLGDAFRPVSYGASGGSTADKVGGSGGGAVHLLVIDEFVLDGTVSASGEHPSYGYTCGAGGGAGGSIWIEVLTGMIEGSGSIRSEGGSGCADGGGGGSGGRVAIYTARADLSRFTGSIVVSGGSQSSTAASFDRIAKYMPAGGTVFVADSSGSNGRLTASNGGRKGADVHAYSSCSYDFSSLDRYHHHHHLDRIYIGDSNLVLDNNCTILVDDGVYTISTNSLFRIHTSPPDSSTALQVKDGVTLIVTGDFSLSQIAVTIEQSSLLFQDDLRLMDSAELSVSSFGSQVTRIGVGKGNITHTSLDAIPIIDSSKKSNITVRNLAIDFNSSLTFLPCSAGDFQISNNITAHRIHVPCTSGDFQLSNNITAHRIHVSRGGRIDASKVTVNSALSWKSQDDLQDNHHLHSYFGKHSGMNHAASGGGSAGFGLAGTGGRTASRGGPRGDFRTPRGGGGPGGSDLSTRIVGGGGGGGECLL